MLRNMMFLTTAVNEAFAHCCNTAAEFSQEIDSSLPPRFDLNSCMSVPKHYTDGDLEWLIKEAARA